MLPLRRKTRAATAGFDGWRYAAFCLGLLAIFVASRGLLLLTSSAKNQNWEEPVFLFSALEVQRLGIAEVWDFQDDLNHGGSIPLTLLGSLWLHWFEPSLLALKWLVLCWWSVAFLAYLVVLRLLFSWPASWFGALAWIAASPNLARLQVTLVGSHPEAVLPALLATAWFGQQLRARRQRWCAQAGIACLASVAAWMSYLLAGWTLALLTAQLWAAPRRLRAALAVSLGGGLGMLPWLYQNVYRRPHGAWLWLDHLASRAASTSTGVTSAGAPFGMLLHWPDAFGAPVPGSWVAAVLLGLAALLAVSGRSKVLPAGGAEVRVLVPVLEMAAVWTALLLACGRIAPLPGEGYYYPRFFVPFTVLLFLLSAGGVEVAVALFGRWCCWGTSAGVAVLGVLGMWPLYGRGVASVPVREEWLRGCLVYGVAEHARAGSVATAIVELSRLSDPECRQRAFNGLGWSLADVYIQRGDANPARQAVESLSERRERFAVCAGMRFVLANSPHLPAPLPLPDDLEVACR